MTMNWSDERYVRVYTRDTPDWLGLSFPAQGLFCLLLRKVDRAGTLHLGRAGRKGAAIAIGHAHQWAMLAPALDELEADGCVQINGDTLVVPNFMEAQEAIASDAQRAREYRARRRDGVTRPQRDVTPRHAEPDTRDGGDTGRDGGNTGRDKTVTPSRTVPSQAEPSEPTHEKRARAPNGSREKWDEAHPIAARLLSALKAHGLTLTPPAQAEVTESIERDAESLSIPLAAKAIADAHDADPHPSLGWYVKALHRAAAGVARAGLEATPPQPLPAPDPAWLEAHPGAAERWAEYEHEVMSKTPSDRLVSQLTGAIRMLKAEFEEAA